MLRRAIPSVSASAAVTTWTSTPLRFALLTRRAGARYKTRSPLREGHVRGGRERRIRPQVFRGDGVQPDVPADIPQNRVRREAADDRVQNFPLIVAVIEDGVVEHVLHIEIDQETVHRANPGQRDLVVAAKHATKARGATDSAPARERDDGVERRNLALVSLGVPVSHAAGRCTIRTPQATWRANRRSVPALRRR